MKKTHLFDVLQISAAIFITGSMTVYAMPITQVHKILPKVVHVVAVVTKPVQVMPAVEPVKVVKWQDNPNHCTSDQYIAATAPFLCIDKPTTKSVPTAAPAPTNVSHNDMMAAAGIAASDYAAVDYIVSHEGSWTGTERWNTAGSGAYGLCQSLPASKMASAGADWATNPITQLKWCNAYAQARYGGWWNAQVYWTTHGNW